MKLTKENLTEWKAELNKIMAEHMNESEKFSDTVSDEDWLNDRVGDTPQEVKDDQLYYSAQN